MVTVANAIQNDQLRPNNVFNYLGNYKNWMFNFVSLLKYKRQMTGNKLCVNLLRYAGLHNLLPVIWRLYFNKLTKLNIQFLRPCKTAITWLRSLLAILPLFWRHDTAELHRLCREDSRNVLWRHEICDVFPRIMTCALQNKQFLQYFTTKFNIFCLNLTGESDFFILFISTHNKLSMSSF